jgi:hypothetical protein
VNITQSYGANTLISRAEFEQPTVVHKDLGNGILLEAVIKRDDPTTTRATGQMTTGAKVWAIVYKNPTGNKIVYSVQQVAITESSGVQSITVKVPTSDTYGVLFITNNTATAPSILGLSEGYPTTGITLSDYTWTDKSPTEDLLYCYTGELTASTTINFLHEFSRVKLKVNSAGLSSTATTTAFAATLDDNPNNASIEDFTSFANFSPSTAYKTTDISLSATGGSAATLTSTQTGNFIPSVTAEDHTITFTGLYLDGNTAATNNYASTPLTFPFNKALVGNTSYTITVNLKSNTPTYGVGQLYCWDALSQYPYGQYPSGGPEQNYRDAANTTTTGTTVSNTTGIADFYKDAVNTAKNCPTACEIWARLTASNPIYWIPEGQKATDLQPKWIDYYGTVHYGGGVWLRKYKKPDANGTAWSLPDPSYPYGLGYSYHPMLSGGKIPGNMPTVPATITTSDFIANYQFLPACGGGTDVLLGTGSQGGVDGIGKQGRFWTSSAPQGSTDAAWELDFLHEGSSSDFIEITTLDRWYGAAILEATHSN